MNVFCGIDWAEDRTQAHVEDRIKELKACGDNRLPSTSYARNNAWLALAAHAVTVLSWLRLLALNDDLAIAEPKTLRFRLLAAPARYVRHARRRVLKIPTGWAWAPTSPTPSNGSERCTRPDPVCPVHPQPQHTGAVEPGAYPSGSGLRPAHGDPTAVPDAFAPSTTRLSASRHPRESSR
ncbi:hypothetical protein FNH13_09725 [Ornithinimicrobium ciconiae]|uniref:Transposase DDE domain-containing protein n=1 Tax=Ornithinimicrobium ciconiae TaxID=2594265 RepID=A0A516GAQ5_9MICO|nr:transposase [Ornithinimicrobium ciconiae]QDO88578.1 hypothetical protein FNH13_09725 [Ornithinimicrobium ciconiae]